MERDNFMMPGDIPDFAQEAEAAMASGETALPEEPKEVTIKFGRGLVGEPFLSKNGKELVEVRIPNVDRSDSRPWESFVISPKMIHDNKFGKGVWMKLPEDGTVRLARNVKVGVDDQGKNIWTTQYRVVTYGELKGLLESYKTRDSVLEKLSEKKDAIASAPKKDIQKTKAHEESL